MLDQFTQPNTYIRQLQMQRHIEGGFFKETYKSTKNFCGEKFEFNWKRFTICNYVLTEGERSVFHKLYVGDEVWSYQTGGGMILHEISSKGKHKAIVLGPNVEKGQLLQYVIEAGNWMAAEVPFGEGFAVCSCIVVPGFEFSDWCIGKCDELVALCPGAKDVIERLT